MQPARQAAIPGKPMTSNKVVVVKHHRLVLPKAYRNHESQVPLGAMPTTAPPAFPGVLVRYLHAGWLLTIPVVCGGSYLTGHVRKVMLPACRILPYDNCPVSSHTVPGGWCRWHRIVCLPPTPHRGLPTLLSDTRLAGIRHYPHTEVL